MICWRFVGSGLAHSCDERQTIENRAAEPVDAVAFDERTSGGSCTARQCRDVARRDLAGSHWRRREGSTDRAIAVRSVRGSHGVVAGLTPRGSNENETRLRMKIAVFGLGYVGCVTAACLARHGHSVVGVDTNEEKVRLVNAGSAPVLEPGLGELIASETRSGRLVASSDPVSAVTGSDLSMICVGTPSAANGSLASTRSSGSLARSAMRLPECPDATRSSCARPFSRARPRASSCPSARGGLRVDGGCRLRLAHEPRVPARRRALADFERPAEDRHRRARRSRAETPSRRSTSGLDAPCFRVPLRVAEMVKYVDNAFHALKIAFANEIGAFCRALGIDSHEVMEPFLADRKLNISEAYLRPGFAFGGSCLPKDLRALVHAARRADLELPLLESILPVERAPSPAHARRHPRTWAAAASAMLGLAFKPGIDDLRESPLVELAETLLGKGYDLRIYDPAVSVSRLVGANREYMVEHLPHLSELLVETVGRARRPCGGLRRRCGLAGVGESRGHRSSGRHVVDLVRLAGCRSADAGRSGMSASRGRRSSSSRTSPSPSTGGSGRRRARFVGPGTASRSICPRGSRQDTEPHEVLDGVEIHRYPLRPRRGGRIGLCARVRLGARPRPRR